MTTLQERVAAHFAESILAKQEAEKVLVEPTAQAAELMLQCLMNDGKILACGNGARTRYARHCHDRPRRRQNRRYAQRHRRTAQRPLPAHRPHSGKPYPADTRYVRLHRLHVA